MLRLRIFLSGPSDVADEAGVASRTIDRLRYDPFVRRGATLEPVHWQRVGAAPILATQTPQKSIDQGMPRPADCDIVVVMLWSRLGTPLPEHLYQKPDGATYGSGTEWEFEDAARGFARSGRPAVLLYRCVRPALVDVRAADAAGQLEQAEAVERFFARLRDPDTGSLLGGYREYSTVDEFRGLLESDLRELLYGLISDEDRDLTEPVERPPLWQGSPFPGLRAFGPADAPIFFGRGRETDELVTRVRDERFVVVVGASGSGKSSLVGAGLVARLEQETNWLVPTQDATSRHWSGLLLSPGGLGHDPFAPLASRLAEVLDLSPPQVREALADPETGARLFDGVVQAQPIGRNVLLVVDQFEELFTVVNPEYVPRFIALLARVNATVAQVHVVATLRADFYHRCLELPELVRLLERGQFPLGTPRDTLLEMIVGPAERAGLRYAEGLPGRILADLGTDAGALPLLAFTLDELHRTSTSGVLTHEAYDQLGGVQGAIGRRAEDAFAQRLDDEARGAFGKVFQELIDVDSAGNVTRRRAPTASVTEAPPSRRLVEVFTRARLLVQAADVPAAPTVTVAHEALFEFWPRLRDWIATAREDLRFLRRVIEAAKEWADNGRRDEYRWPHERLHPLDQVRARLEPRLDDVVLDFIEPEWVRVLGVLGDPRNEPHQRRVAADRLLALGDAAIPGLAKLMAVGEPATRELVVATLTRFASAAVPALEDLLTSDDAAVRLNVLAALREIGDSRALAGFAAALEDPNVEVRSFAIGAIEAMQGGPPVAGEEGVDPAWRAVGHLGGAGPNAVRPLLIVAGGQDPELQNRALAALVNLASPGELVAALLDVLPGVRAAAAATLVARGGPVPPEVLAALEDPDAEVRMRVAQIAGALGDPRGVGPLARALDDSDPAVSCAAVKALGRCGAAAVAPLVDRLGDDQLADAVIGALADLGSSAIEALVDVLRSPRAPAVRARAITVIRALGAVVEPALLGLLSSADASGRARAGGALVALGARATPALVQALESAPARVADDAAALLAEIGDPGPAALLTKSDLPAITRRRVARALEGAPLDDARKPLLHLLTDGDTDVRAAAAASLVSAGRPGIQLLARAAGGDDIAAAESALKALGSAGPDAVGPLLDLASSQPERAVPCLRAISTVSALLGLAELGLEPVGLSREHMDDTQR